jgi:hypothetical protein
MTTVYTQQQQQQQQQQQLLFVLTPQEINDDSSVHLTWTHWVNSVTGGAFHMQDISFETLSVYLSFGFMLGQVGNFDSAPLAELFLAFFCRFSGMTLLHCLANLTNWTGVVQWKNVPAWNFLIFFCFWFCVDNIRNQFQTMN